MRITSQNAARFRRSGFTLVELLVAIAIIAVLAGLGLFGTKMAMAASTKTKAINNIRTVGVVLEQLAQEGIATGGAHPRGTFPPSEGQLITGTEFVWYDLVANEIGIAEREGSRFDWNTLPRESQLQNPLSKHKLGGDNFTGFNSRESTLGGFTYNAKLAGPVGASGAAAAGLSVSMSSLDDAANTILIGETDDEVPTTGLAFEGIEDAPQGNADDSVHVFLIGGEVRPIPNSKMKEPRIFDFYTEPRNKDYNAIN